MITHLILLLEWCRKYSWLILSSEHPLSPSPEHKSPIFFLLGGGNSSNVWNGGGDLEVCYLYRLLIFLVKSVFTLPLRTPQNCQFLTESLGILWCKVDWLFPPASLVFCFLGSTELVTTLLYVLLLPVFCAVPQHHLMHLCIFRKIPLMQFRVLVGCENR